MGMVLNLDERTVIRIPYSCHYKTLQEIWVPLIYVPEHIFVPVRTYGTSVKQIGLDYMIYDQNIPAAAEVVVVVVEVKIKVVLTMTKTEKTKTNTNTKVMAKKGFGERVMVPCSINKFGIEVRHTSMRMDLIGLYLL